MSKKNYEDLNYGSCYRYCYVVGPTGPTGPAGTSGILNYADFYALMPPDNAATVAPRNRCKFSSRWTK